MSCFHPLKAFELGLKDNGKKDLKITSYDVDHLEFKHGKWQKVYDGVSTVPVYHTIRKHLEVPCGQCIGCRLDYARQWADRCMLETKYHNNNWFLTLTYDNEHLPLHSYEVADTGEICPSMSLVKKDFQDFIKRLRRYCEYHNICSGQDIKYFACGEYGDESSRPHYHAIIYGLPIQDLEIFKKSQSGGLLYTSNTIQNEIWHKGIIALSEVTWDTCCYVARYVTKKAKGDMAKLYDELNIEPEFILMSKSPSIGKSYFIEHCDEIYEHTRFFIGTDNGARPIKPSRYYDKLYDLVDSEHLNEIKEERIKNAKDTSKLKREKFNASTHTIKKQKQMLKIEEDNLTQKTKQLSRKEI